MYPSPCPMERQGIMQMTVADTSAMDHDCCNDARTAAETGKLCKFGQMCQVSVQYPIIFHVTFSLPVAQAIRYPDSAPPLYSRDALSIWRPPTPI